MTTLLDRTFLGMEFGDDSVVLALLKNSVSGINLISSETFSLKKGVDTVNEVRDFISGQGAAINNVFVSIPDKWALTKFTDIPSIKGRNKKTLSNMMQFEIERHIPFSIDTVSYDSLILQKKANSFEVVFIAVQNEKIAIVKDFLEKLALHPHTITLSSFAVLSAIELSGVPVGGLQEIIGITRRSNIFGNKDEGVSLYIKGIHATLSIIREGLCIYLRTFDFSVDKAAQMLFEAADRLSIKKFDKLLVVSGDISSLKEIADELIEKLAAENVEVTEISAFIGDVHGKEMNRLAAPIGACFSGLGIGTHRINVLPHKMEFQIKNVAPLATKIFLILVVVMLIGIFAIGAVKQKHYLEALEAAIKKNEPDVMALQEITSDIDLLNKQSNVLYKVKQNTVALEVLAELTAVMPSDSWVTNLQYKGFDIQEKKDGGELTISGLASSSSMLISLLEDSVYFEKVEFVGPIKKKGLKEQFKIKAVVLMPSGKESQ